MKHVLINGKFLHRQSTGVDRFAIEAVRAINNLLNESELFSSEFRFSIFVSSSNPKVESFNHIEPIFSKSSNWIIWEQCNLAIAANKADVLLNLCNSAPLLLNNQVCVVHDVTPVRVPKSYSRNFRLWYKFMIPTLYSRSASICTVSHFSKCELLAVYGSRKCITVLPEGTDHLARIKADDTILNNHKLCSRPYILAVSSLSPHKNFSAVVQAVQLMGDVDFDVVIAGGQNPKVFAGGGYSLPDSVKYVGYVSDSELKALYENAACFVFPSIYEGYGLPPTEAMACGCPVVAARAASIPEVCGDAALYFDPHNPQELALLLQRMMSDPALRATMAERGRARASTMRWRNTALALLEEIRRIAQ